MVIAGAGSGKTRVLTYKIAYLISRGVQPWNILALTFTNKAAREMNQRIASIVGEEEARRVWSGTFQESERTGFSDHFTIYDTSDSKSLIKTIIKEMALDEKVYKPQTVACRISEAKNALVLPADYRNSTSTLSRDRKDGLGRVGEIYETYCKRCRTADAMDFDDLLLHTFLLFRDFPEVCQKYKSRFQYILVDEYQDTNMAQHRIIRQLTDPDSRLCVVGDDAQSIYSFRGAEIDNILLFNQQYAGAPVFKLERNYRSTQTIVDAANSLIRHNERQIFKKTYSTGEKGEKIKLYIENSDTDEALRVATEIRRLHRSEDIGFDEIAILYRTNAQSRSFEETFLNTSIPYRIYGGLSFYQRKEVKDAIAYFRLVCNPNDEEAFKRIVNYPARGIGKTTLDRLQWAAVEADTSLWEVAGNPEAYGAALAKATQTKLRSFIGMIEGFRKELHHKEGHELALQILRESGMGADIASDTSPEGLSRKENIEELIGSIQSIEIDLKKDEGYTSVHLDTCLPAMSLYTDADQQDNGEPKVTLMTIHAAKGLEFETVFVTGMEADLFPNSSARFSKRDMEEERRLFYVAITRAKRHCYLTMAKTRYRYGQLEFAEESPFLQEIAPEYIERKSKRSTLRTPRTRNIFSSYMEGSNTPTYPSTSKQTTAHNGANPSWNTVKKETASPAPSSSSAMNVMPSRLRSVPSAIAGNRSTTAPHSGKNIQLKPGDKIEHERFGRGTVISVDGAGDNAKACVEFEQVGRKNLLLKFATITRM